MIRIEDEKIKFYLEHATRIREWAALEGEVLKFVDRFYCSLKGDLDEAVRSGRIGEDGIRSILREGNWPGVGFRRQDWPESSTGS